MEVKSKAYKIIDTHVAMTTRGFHRMPTVMALCEALYFSAKGTKHFYEAMDMLKDVDEAYLEEFEELKKKHQ